MHDLEAAKALADASAAPGDAALSKLGRLVEAMIKLQSLNGVIFHKASFMLLMPGNTGIHARDAGDPATRASLVHGICQLRMELCINGTLPEAYAMDLPDDSEEYKQGLAEVRAHVVKDLRYQVERQVVKRNEHLGKLERAEGSKNAASNRKGLNKCNDNIKDLLRTLSTWEVYGTAAAPAWLPTDDTIRKVNKGEFPWSTENPGSSAPEALQRHYGVRYRAAAAQVARAEEEIEYLRMEAVLLVNGLEERIEAVEQAMVVDQSVLEDVVAGTAGDAARKAKVLEGRIQLLGMERERLELIKEQADKLRATHDLGTAGSGVTPEAA